MHRSYVPKEWIDSFLLNAAIELPDDAVNRFFSVVRIKPDEVVAVFDGVGREIVGAVARHDKKSCTFLAGVLRCEQKNSPQLVVVQAALDDGKISETIQRGCEFGVDQFVLFNAERSERFCFDKLQKKHDRLLRIAQNACRQSHRLFVPPITYVPLLSEAILPMSAGTCVGLFGDTRENQLLSRTLAALTTMPDAFCVVVGPEGGLSVKECDTLRTAGFFGVRFAPFVLRSELACLSAIAVVNAHCGRA